MKNIRWALFSTFVTALLVAPFAPFVSAAGASMYMSPASRSVSKSAIILINVRVNGGGAGVNAVQANVAYPTDKLEYLNSYYSGTSFEVQAESSWGGGVVRMARGTLSPINGDALVGTISFRVLASSGSATLSFAGGSTVAANGTEIGSGKGSANMTFTPPQSGGGSSSNSTPGAPPPPKDTTPPAISGIYEKSIGLNSATIVWKTDEDANAVVEYSLDQSYALSASVAALSKVHEVTLPAAAIQPKTTYFYRVKSADAAGNVKLSEVRKFTSKGIPVTVKVNDEQGQPLAGVKVSIGDSSSVTDPKGIAVLSSASGKQQVLAEFSGATSKQQLEVTSGKEGIGTKIAVTLAADKSSSGGRFWQILAISLGLGFVVLAALDAYIFRKKVVVLADEVLKRRSRPKIITNAVNFLRLQNHKSEAAIPPVAVQKITDTPATTEAAHTPVEVDPKITVPERTVLTQSPPTSAVPIETVRPLGDPLSKIIIPVQSDDLVPVSIMAPPTVAEKTSKPKSSKKSTIKRKLKK